MKGNVFGKAAASLKSLLAFALLIFTPALAKAAEVTIAVAANFTAAAQEIAEKFQAETSRTVSLSFGSTGQLYAQIIQGAPFDILLSADAARAKKAEDEGWGVAGSGFTYAIGRLVLWSAKAELVDAEGAVLRNGNFTHLAIANPATAPYGAAAVEAMQALGLYDQIAPKIVQGENIIQTYQFAASGNAELGFVALSQVLEAPGGSHWLVPENLHAPILQDAVLLKAGEQNRFAVEFLAWLKSPPAVSIIEKHDYTLPRAK
ncbi:MAG: molybdate transport system substrate-binding protein [Alphaproteobacteria bacterium]|nr:molybdate transport system substrate-binding protein [Alphaproteobacteria bacterium]